MRCPMDNVVSEQHETILLLDRRFGADFDVVQKEDLYTFFVPVSAAGLAGLPYDLCPSRNYASGARRDEKARWADPGSEAAGSGVTGVNRRIIVQNRNGGFLYPVPINTCESNTLTSP